VICPTSGWFHYYAHLGISLPITYFVYSVYSKRHLPVKEPAGEALLSDEMKGEICSKKSRDLQFLVLSFKNRPRVPSVAV